MKIIPILMVVFCLTVPRVFGDDPVGNIESIAGTATAQGASGAARTLAKEAPVYLNDRISTGPDSKIAIRFIDNTTVGEGENAELVINRYVFAPDNKAKNEAAFKLIKGAFRFITDQITKLNPEKFEVEGNYGTIGIRGCELGFNMGSEYDDVFVIGLTGKENILFNLTAGKKGTLTVREAGMAVSMSALEGLKERRFDPADVQHLIELTSPVIHATGAGKDHGQDYGSMHGPGSGSHDPSKNTPDSGVGAPPGPVNQIVADTQFDQQQQNQSPPLNTPGGLPTGAPAPPPPNTGGSGPDNSAGGGNSGGGGGPTPGGNGITVAPAFPAAHGSGTDWSWGIWGVETTTHDAAGNAHKNIHSQVVTIGRNLDPAYAQAIATGPVLYNLTGTGDAGAAVIWGEQAEILLGTATIGVQIGQTVSPTWTGAFAMQNANGDSLQFNVRGVVAVGGDLQAPPGNPINYSLDAFGQTWGQPVSSQISGNLVGSGVGSTPISGAIVRYDFDHGPDNPVVHGAAGADLH